MKEMGSPVLWVCDPMHGNTESTSDGTKTRRFRQRGVGAGIAFKVHESMGSYLGGVHLELTGENVTECTGGARGLTDSDLARAYKSTVDPRLNYEQAMEVAMRIAGLDKWQSPLDQITVATVLDACQACWLSIVGEYSPGFSLSSSPGTDCAANQAQGRQSRLQPSSAAPGDCVLLQDVISIQLSATFLR